MSRMAPAQKTAKGKPASRTKKAAASTATGKNVDEEELALQAVVLADSFETRFNPFSLEKPRASTSACGRKAQRL